MWYMGIPACVLTAVPATCLYGVEIFDIGIYFMESLNTNLHPYYIIYYIIPFVGSVLEIHSVSNFQVHNTLCLILIAIVQ